MGIFHANMVCALLACFILQSHALTYWMDSSCTNPLVGVMAEVQDMAAKGKLQLADSSNTIMAAVFKQIFKVDTSDSGTVSKVSGENDDSLARHCHECLDANQTRSV